MQIATYTGSAVGYGLLLVLAIRDRSGRERGQRLLETILLLAIVWTLCLALLRFLTSGDWWGHAWVRAAQVGLVILALHTGSFADAFVRRPPRLRLRIGVVAPLVAVAIGLDLLPAFLAIEIAPVPFLRLGALELATLTLSAAWLFATGTTWWTWAMAFRHAMGTKHRNRLRYLGIVLLAFAIGDLLILIGNIPRIHTGLALRLIGFTIATIAVLRHDLPDIRRLTQATLRVGLLSAVTAGLYLAGLIVAGSASGIIPHLPSPTTAGVAVGLVLLFVALIDVTLTPRLRRILDRTMLGEGYDAQKALRAHSQQIHLILDPERLADTTLDWLNTHLRTRHAAFILFTPQRHGRTQLRILRSTSAPVPGPQSFGSDSRFIAHFHNIGRPLSQYDLDMLSWFQSMPAAEQRWLKALAVDLYVPILGTNKCVAMLALGPKASQQPFSESDLEILMILADQTSTALENARLLGDLRAVQVDLNRLSTELAETNRQLKRLDRTKTDFITIASHELRTPLTQISGYSEILAQLKSEELGDTHLVHDFVDGIARGAQRLRQVVDAMVDVSLIETQSLTLDLEPQSVDAIMDSALEAIGPMVTARRQTLKLGDLSLLPRVLADGARLRQVFVSLLSNAVKFTPDGGQITLSGRTVPSDEDERIVELLVTDNGIGIDRDHQDLIFEKFYRPEHLLAHSTDTSRFKGAGPGLGLAIARGIVEAHGGRIWVESPQRDERACPGSTFYVQLPAGGPGED